MEYKIDHIAVRQGFNGRTFWAQARAGVIPSRHNGPHPTIVLTAQPALRSGSDVFFALSEWCSTDLGGSWSGPVEHAATLGRRQEKNGIIVGICDMTPGWHAA
ncbi:MAG: exo-alpha-sialidase, partial [Kiritimatiellia bacterium]